MANLRERQKERRERGILRAATKLIEEKGWENTSIEEVAAKAEVGVATVYNYFGSKIELLHAIFNLYLDEQIAVGRKVIEDPPASALDGMIALFSAYADGMINHFGKRVMEEFFGLALSPQYSYGKDVMPMKMRFVEQMVELMDIYCSQGQIRQDIEKTEAAMLCYSVISIPLWMFVVVPEMSLDDAKQKMRSNLQLLFDGIQPSCESTKGVSK
jgi:AcrR family transcriptional regulator